MVREHGGDGEIVVPPTIHALLQARIDSLDGDVRVVMERGSVEGEVFHRGAVAAALARSCSRRRRVASDDARAQGAHPLDGPDLPRGRGLPLPPPAHPRRRVRVAAEGDARGAARAVRRLALDARLGRRRRDRRVPPRAGASLPVGARSGSDPALAALAGRASRLTSRLQDAARSIAATTTPGVRSCDARARSSPSETRHGYALAADYSAALFESRASSKRRGMCWSRRRLRTIRVTRRSHDGAAWRLGRWSADTTSDASSA